MKEKQKKITTADALRLFHTDGVVEVVAGATLLNFGFDVLNGAETTNLFTWLPIILLSSMKNKSSLPRIEEQLKDVPEKQTRSWILIPSVIMILALIILGVMMLSDPLNLAEASFLPIEGDLKTFVSSLILAVICLVPAVWINLKQFYVFAAVAFTTGVAGFFILPAAWPFFITAVAMLAFGTRAMIRFSKDNPLVEEKTVNED